ncbi:MAG: GyrI-like domain-containing protein [Anaerolineae bacterium]|nr:GyrI-like domain-containing protein [Anaerolineae bacterium]
MPKIDYRKELGYLYSPPQGKMTLVEVPPLSFLMIDGEGDPEREGPFQEALQALYAVSYGLRFALKREGIEYTVGPLEGLWPCDLGDFSPEARSRWQWTTMIMQPEPVTAERVEQIRSELARKKALPALERLRLERFHEGLSVQTMYVGAYADEGPTIERLHAFIRDQGYAPNGRHHEIYLGDPRRTAPEKLRTVIRQPVRKRDP